LARTARKVTALEVDPALAPGLRRRFRGAPNVEILVRDFLEYRIGEEDYKIFASIPYNRTAEVVRKILRSDPSPKDAFLVMQKEAAEKISGRPKETRFSILAKPYFRIRILCGLRRRDFSPVPNVDSALLRIQRRDAPLIPARDAALYRSFIGYGFGVWKQNVRSILKPVFSRRQWKRLSQDLRLPPAATPSGLTFEQWLGLFHFFRDGIYRRGIAMK
jgi:23S rRNA (adenine-N6)-dimethyltransferase